MGNIAFEKISSTFTILNPFNNFAPEAQSVEVRKDPLLGDTSVYNPYLKDKARAFFGPNDPELIQTLARESAKNCIFCGENVVSKTARYPVRYFIRRKDTERAGRALCKPFLRGRISSGHRPQQRAFPEAFGVRSSTDCGRI